MRKTIKRTAIALIIAMLLAVSTYAKTKIDLTAEYDVPTVGELQAGLLYDLKQYAEVYLEAAEEYGINVYFLCAKDGLESDWGRQTIAKNNFGGWTLLNGDYKAFDTAEQAIWYRAKNIKVMYLTPKPPDAEPNDITGDYFNGYDLAAVNICYNGTDAWLNAVNGIWYDIERRVARYRAEREGNDEKL